MDAKKIGPLLTLLVQRYCLKKEHFPNSDGRGQDPSVIVPSTFTDVGAAAAHDFTLENRS